MAKTNMTYDPDTYEFEDENMVAETKVVKKGGKSYETTITKRELTNDGPPDTEQSFAALFAAGETDSNREDDVVSVRVTRVDPDEGSLGTIDDMNFTEADIKERWGGSRYRLQGLTSRGKICRVRMVTIAGDPIFAGKMFAHSYYKKKGLTPPVSDSEPQKGTSVQEMLSLIEEREEKRLAQHQEFDAVRRKRDAEDLERRTREEREWQAQRRKDEEDREDRRRREDEERDRRRRDEQRDSQVQSQQFMSQMLALVTSQAAQSIAFVKETLTMQQSQQSDPSEMLMKGIELAKMLSGNGGGESNDDILTTVVKNLPSMLNAAGNVVGKAVREIKAAPAPITPETPRRLPAAQPVIPENSFVLSPGIAATKMKALADKIAAAGGDVPSTLASIADKLMQAEMGSEASTPAPVDAAPATTTIAPEPAKPGMVRMTFERKNAR